MPVPSRTRGLVAAVLAASLAAVPVAANAVADVRVADAPAAAELPLTALPAVADPSADRQAVPEDEYAMALGCYALTAADGTQVGLDGGAYGAAAGSFHFEPTQLGQYLLLDEAGTLLSAERGAAEEADAAVEEVEFHSPVTRDTTLTRTLRDDVPNPLADDSVGSVLPTVDTYTGAVVPGVAGPESDWRVRQNVDGTFTFVLPAASGRALAWDGTTLQLADAGAAGDAANFSLATAEGCAAWPEVEVNVEGPVLAGATPWIETRGTIDAHLHLMAYEFLGGELRCGRPWHPYGVTEALGDCSQAELVGASLQEGVLGYGPDGYAARNDNLWPTFTVPTSRTLTYEQVYHRWLERAWRSGLRMMTVLLVDNNVLCEAFPYKRNSCNEMDAVRLQAQRLREFVDYLDARAGGPGEGFAQIATTPFEAREIVNSGRLAFIMGIEVSVLFDCGEYLGVSTCTNADIVRQLDEIQDLGVVQMELVNKFDNALSGVTGDGGETGIIVNNGNRDETGHYWHMETCPAEEERRFGTDKRQLSLADEAAGTPFEEPARDELAGQILAAAGYAAGAPAYPVGPHCNVAGLTSQGQFLLQEMAARGMLFDPDHMSARAATEALDVLEELGYPGVVSSHSWSQDEVYERIYGMGGTITPYAGGSSGFVNAWRQRLGWVDDRYYFGFGYGADTNGLGGQGGPRNPDEANDVDYPFTVAGGAVVHQQVSGERTYDINTDGVAHYGLYADWVEDLRVQAGDEIYEDMLRGPEAYLQVWERAVGVPKDACAFGDGTTDPTDGVRVGMSYEDVLFTAGQPRVRDAAGYTYCGVAPGGPTHVTVRFDAAGTVTGVQERPATAPLPALNRDRGVQAAMATAEVRTDVPEHDHEDEAHQHADGTEHLHAAGAVETAAVPAAAATGGSPLVLAAVWLLGLGLLARRHRRPRTEG